jgi:two-component system phosphate regulon response regulator PhoB
MAAKILLVEDEADIRDLIQLHLERERYLVIACGNGAEAKEKIKNHDYDLLLLDWMLPGVSGIELARTALEKRGSKTAPAILMLTAKSAPNDIVMGLEAGADDYVVKPFELSVLLARVRALLRRVNTPKSQKIQIGDLHIDTSAHEVRCANIKISLTPYEFKLLQALAENRGKVLTRDHLIQLVQGDGVAVVERSIDTHMFGLRKKIQPCSDLLETVRGIGYRMAPLSE